MLSAAELGGKIYEQLMLVGIKRHRSVLAGELDDTLGTANARADAVGLALDKSLGQAGIRLANLDEAGLPGQTKALREILTEAERWFWTRNRSAPETGCDRSTGPRQ